MNCSSRNKAFRVEDFYRYISSRFANKEDMLSNIKSIESNMLMMALEHIMENIGLDNYNGIASLLYLRNYDDLSSKEKNVTFDVYRMGTLFFNERMMESNDN